MTDVFARLRAIRPEIERKYPVRLVGVFGSHARGDARPDSDVDVLFESTGAMSYYTLAEIELRLEAELGLSVDLVPKRALKPRIRDRVLAETIGL